MLNFPIVDTHVHFWDPSFLRYSWLDEIPILNKRYLLEEYREACGKIHVDQLVFVQCECNSGENLKEARWISDLSRKDKRIRGIVANVPIENGTKIKDDLDKLVQIPLVKGIRRLLQGETVDFCLQSNFVEGVRALPDYDLSFDLCIFHPQLTNTIELVRRCPEVSFVLDHIGKPDIKNKLFDPWKVELERLAEFPNIFCKISGMVTEANMTDWVLEDLKPYIDLVINSFGIDRVMFGGDWPVAVQASDYPRWVETLCLATSSFSELDQRKLFRDNAISFYRL